MVYILEAHPIDAWQDEDNVRDNIALANPRSFQERCALADTCAAKLAMKFPSVIDDLKNSTEIAYTAWPDRLYVIDYEGRIAYKSRPGPYGFKPREAAETLKRLILATPTRGSLSRQGIERLSH